MSIDEFQKTDFYKSQQVVLHKTKETHDVVSVDFEEALIATKFYDTLMWHRCENVTLIQNRQS